MVRLQWQIKEGINVSVCFGEVVVLEKPKHVDVMLTSGTRPFVTCSCPLASLLGHTNYTRLSKWHKQDQTS